MIEKKYIDVQAWLRQCNPSWMYMDVARQIIKAAPVAEVFGQWIDAAEQPPTEPDEYIVMIAGAASSTVLHFDIDDEGKGVWFQEVEDSTNFYKVTHWMPLPEGPKKQPERAKLPNVCKCRSCGAEIVWVTMQSGKKMPCDAELIHAVEEGDAKTSFVLPGGIVKRGREGRHPNGEADFVGYRSHFETCPQADRFRKRGQGDG